MPLLANGVVVAFDTATSQIALACAELADGALTHIASADCLAPRHANEQLVPRLSALMEEQGCSAKDISCVVCGVGPGSFTGVRIGVATAKGIAVGLGVPLYPASTIDAVAWGLWRGGVRGLAGIVADAMRKEVYPVRYSIDDAGPSRLDPDTVSKPDSIAHEWAAAGQITLAGDGLLKHRGVFEDAFAGAGSHELRIADEGLWRPSGLGLLDALAARLAAGDLGLGNPSDLLPVYTRLSDAEENERRRLGMRDAVVAGNGVADAVAEHGLVLVPMSVNDVPRIVQMDAEEFGILGAAGGGSAATAAAAATAATTAITATIAAVPSQGSALSTAAMYDSLARPDETWWVAREHGETVGFTGVRVTRGEAQVLRIVVAKEARKAGVGARLLARAAHDAQDLGALRIVLELSHRALECRGFFSAMGFAEADAAPANSSSQAIRMAAPLPLRALVVSAAQNSVTPSHKVAGMDIGELAKGSAGAHEEARPLILAIESSCDETGAAIICGDDVLASDVVASQVDFHARFGGVVPEIASRKHTEAIVGVVEEALEHAGAHFGACAALRMSDLDAIAVTTGPGLVGALVVGVAFAKGAAWACGLPLIEVNHLEGHLYANKLIDPSVSPPLVALLVSGGNTMLVHVRDWGDYEIMGATLDDAVGEAFDKVAKALGLGYPGGPVLSRLAKEGNPKAMSFPRAMLHSHDYRFSLSGLKTAVVTYIHQANEAGRAINLPDLAASFQAAVVDVLVAKAKAAVLQTGVKEFCVGGGVAANPELRHDLARAMKALGVHVTLPPFSACTDNAGMIAAVARVRFAQGKLACLSVDAKPGMNIEEAY